MDRSTQYSADMPGICTPSPTRAHAISRTSYFEAAPHFVRTTESSGRQVIDPDAHETRKRSRNDCTTQPFMAGAWNDDSLAYSRFTDTKSPPPLAHDRYQLADGGMDRSQTLGRQVGDYDDYFQLQKQRGHWSVPPTPYTGMKQMAMDGVQSTPSEAKPWSLLGLVGGVAGKLFQFCTVPFRGFHAGGGQRFTVDSQEEIAERLGLQADPFLHQRAGPVQHATPGRFPEDDYGVKSVDSIESERHERPRTKRLRTADNWVVVSNDGEVESRPTTPRLAERRVPDQLRSPSQIPRPVSRAGASTPSLKRPSLIPVSRRSTTDRRSIHGSSKAVSSSHSRQRSHNRLSYGSPALPVERAAKKPASPLPKDSQRLINKVRREEMEEDARMRRMSSQMSAMLREAKEALGSRFEIEDEYDDDGDYDDGGSMQQSGHFPRFS
jgi:hypothetical protein